MSQEKHETQDERPSPEPQLLHPLADLYQDEESFVWLIELPGVSPDGLDLEVVEGKLVLDATTAKQNYRYTRRLKIPASGDVSEIDASLEDGLLRIEVRKRVELRPRKIALGTKS
jgi:HSP20 family molecular chaperone IbpA